MEFYSHKDTLLIDHLSMVKDYSLIYGNKNFKDLHQIIACCHDFGKYTNFFQDRLFKKEGVKKPEGNHAHISAVFAAYTIINLNLGEGFLPLLAYSVILSHHSRVKNFYNYLPRITKNQVCLSDKNYIKVQILNNQKKNLMKNYEYIYKDYKILGLGEIFKSFVDDEYSIEKTFIELRKAKMLLKEKSDLYWIHQELFSVLIASDKISASKTNPLEQKFIGYEELEKIREDCFAGTTKSKINDIRNEIFNIVQTEIQKNSEQKIFSITAPTGSGKTMTGFFAALKLRMLKPELKKIIYVLPYTSIINQNYDKIRNLYIKSPNVSNNEYHYIMKHHHLSNYEKDKDDEIYDEEKYQILLENWEGGTVITTFVQLLETVVGAVNKMLKKFHALRNSIILMDEVQAVDIKYFKLLNYIFEYLSKELNCHIIIMTATKPLFFPKAIELVDNHEDFFQIFNRTRLISHLDDRFTVKQFADFFAENLRDKSYMIVVNTINQSLKMFDLIKDYLDYNNKHNHQLYYLSTNLIPKHRVERINEIDKKLKNKERIILVSTQVVEAGIDLDFDEVYRDIAPLDSIIQCSGRCNRNDGGNIGNVHIVQMEDEDGRIYGEKVYGPDVLNITKNVLSDRVQIEEKDYLYYINRYYEKIKEHKSQQSSIEYIRSIENLNFDETDKYEIGKFSLITDNPGYLDVFIACDGYAEKLLNDYKETYKISDIEIKQKSLLPLKKEIQQYIISMPEKYWRTLDKFEVTNEYMIPYIPLSGIKSYYDPMTGYKREKDDSMIFF